MKLRSVGWRQVIYLALILVILAATPVMAKDNGVRQQGDGRYANLTAVWWTWALSQPAVDVNGTNTNPILDSTGAYAAVGQENGIGPANKFFFLTGTFGSATRYVTVPSGKALFFPVINFDADNAADPATDYSVPELRKLARSFIDDATGLYARLDGAQLEIFRTKSPVFEYTLPDENSYYEYFGLVGPQFEGTIRPAVSDGYWVYVDPLPPGEYVLEFGASSGDFSLDVTYYLTVQ